MPACIVYFICGAPGSKTLKRPSGYEYLDSFAAPNVVLGVIGGGGAPAVSVDWLGRIALAVLESAGLLETLAEVETDALAMAAFDSIGFGAVTVWIGGGLCGLVWTGALAETGSFLKPFTIALNCSRNSVAVSGWKSSLVYKC